MTRQFSNGDIIFDIYEVRHVIRKNPIYVWLETFDTIEKRVVFLQLLNVIVNNSELNFLFEFFDELQRFGKKGILTPLQVIQTAEEQLLLVYDQINQNRTIIDAIKEHPEKALDLWKQASELLFALHNQNLIHGSIDESSFLVDNDRVFLCNFGYSPLINSGNEKVIHECRSNLSPEFKKGSAVTVNDDIYAFANLLTKWKADLGGTEWYARAVGNHPARFIRMREMFAFLVKDIEQLDTPSASSPPPSSPPKNEGGLVPKCSLSIATEPIGSGTAFGQGNYAIGDIASVTVKDNAGWLFIRWSGDVVSEQRQIDVEMDTNKKIVAHFCPNQEEAVKYHLSALARPEQAGTVLGAGHYERGAHVELVAKPAAGWIFSQWEGAISIKDISTVLIMDCDKQIVAIFKEAPKQSTRFSLNISSSPSFGGNVIVKKLQFNFGETTIIEAIPEAGWNFEGWYGDFTGNDNPAKISMSADKKITAKFLKKQKVNLSFLSDPDGVGISFEKKCFINDKINISAKAFNAIEWVFDYWSGDLQGTKASTTIIMDRDKAVTAHYKKVDMWGGGNLPSIDKPKEEPMVVIGKLFCDEKEKCFKPDVQDSSQNNETKMNKEESNQNRESFGSRFENTKKDSENDKAKQRENKNKQTNNMVGSIFLKG